MDTSREETICIKALHAAIANSTVEFAVKSGRFVLLASDPKEVDQLWGGADECEAFPRELRQMACLEAVTQPDGGYAGEFRIQFEDADVPISAVVWADGRSSIRPKRPVDICVQAATVLRGGTAKGRRMDVARIDAGIYRISNKEAPEGTDWLSRLWRWFRPDPKPVVPKTGAVSTNAPFRDSIAGERVSPSDAVGAS